MIPACKVLIVDDDLDDCLILKGAIRNISADNMVSFCHTSDEAEQYLSDFLDTVHFPTLIVLDIRLPVKDGIHFLRTIRSCKSYDGLNVVVVTGYMAQHAKSECQQLGVQHFFQKPATDREYQSIAGFILESCNKLRSN